MADIKDSKLLFVEDEPVLAEIVSESLRTRGFTVIHADTVKAALQCYQESAPDLLILDVMLPDGDGFSLARHIRHSNTEIPVIFLTSKSRPDDVVEGFESGGNDYVKKPFSIEELIVRIKALLSKNRLVMAPEPSAQTTALGNYLFEYPAGTLSFMGSSKTLTTRESELLQMLILNKNRILDRNTILMTLWNNNDYFTGRSLDVFVTKLRRYLKNDPAVNILNIRGQGYKLICNS